MEAIHDPINLTAISSLVNLDHVDTKIDRKKIEQEIIGNTIEKQEVIDPNKVFDDVMGEFMKEVEGSAPDQQTSEAPEKFEFQVPTYTDPKPDYNKYDMNFSSPTIPSTPLQKITQEQQNQQQINQVMSKFGRGYMNENFNKEREIEDKLLLMEKIDFLRGELEDRGIDIKHITIVTQDNSINTIRNIMQILENKYNRHRYYTMANETILSVAHGMEYVFDGNRKIGPWQPDLTGWHNTVRVKLRHMKYETSTIVSDLVREYNIGPWVKIGLELVPSAFLYSRLQSEKNKEDEIFVSEEEAKIAMNEIDSLND